MAQLTSEKFPIISENSTMLVSNRYIHPELSEDPIFSPSSKKDLQQFYGSPPEVLKSEEYNLSSLQISTQHSLNLKRSFFASPKRSVPSTPFLLTNKIKELKGQTLNLKLNEKLKELEESSKTRKTEDIELTPLIDIIDTKELSLRNNIKEGILIEGEDDNEVPSLKWCAYCKGEVRTEAFYINTNKTFWASVGIFFSGGVLGCFLFPYFTNSCKGLRTRCHVCKRGLS